MSEDYDLLHSGAKKCVWGLSYYEWFFYCKTQKSSPLLILLWECDISCCGIPQECENQAEKSEKCNCAWDKPFFGIIIWTDANFSLFLILVANTSFEKMDSGVLFQ